MFKKVLFLATCLSFAMPQAKATNVLSQSPYVVVDDDDDDDKKDDKKEKEEKKYDILLLRSLVECRKVSKDSADLMVRVRLRSKKDCPMPAIVQVTIEDKEGNQVAFLNDKIDIPAQKGAMSNNIFTIKNPHIHSVDPSYRYKAEIEILDLNGEEISKSKEFEFYISPDLGAARRHPGSLLKQRTNNVKLQRQVK